MTTVPTSIATTIVRVATTRPLFGSVKPTASKRLKSPSASPKPTSTPTTDASTPTTSASITIDVEHLAPRGAERAQRRELARALGDRDRERVRDHEAADEERDAAEREQEVLQEADEARRVRRVLGRLRLAGPHLRARRQDLLDLGRELLGRDPGFRLRADLVELADAAEEHLRRRQVEAGERRAAEARRAAELDEARRSSSAAPGPFASTPIVWPTSRSFLPAVALSTTSSPAPGQLAVDERERVELRAASGSTLKPRCGAPPKAITLPLWPTRFAIPPTPPTASGDVGQGAHLLRAATRSNGGAGRARLVGEVERRLAGDGRVGAAVDLGEDPVEGALDRVGEDVRARHHRDAEHDRDRRQHRPQLAAEEARQRDPLMRRLRAVTRCGSSWPGSPTARCARARPRSGRRPGTGSGRRSPRRRRRG